MDLDNYPSKRECEWMLVEKRKNLSNVSLNVDGMRGSKRQSSEDNATLLRVRDILDYVRSRNLKYAFIAIDHENTFDCVDWVFMHKVLTHVNFGPIIPEIIKCLYTNVQSATELCLMGVTFTEGCDIGVRYLLCFLC